MFCVLHVISGTRVSMLRHVCVETCLIMNYVVHKGLALATCGYGAAIALNSVAWIDRTRSDTV